MNLRRRCGWRTRRSSSASLEEELTLTASRHNNRAAYLIALHDLIGAHESAQKGLRLARRAQDELQLAIALQHLALLAALTGDTQRGAQLLGYVDAQYEQLGMKRQPTEQWGYQKLLIALDETLSEDEIARFKAEGAAWSEDQIDEEALYVSLDPPRFLG